MSSARSLRSFPCLVGLAALVGAGRLGGADYAPVEVAPQADDTGMVPGDVVFGNLVDFPGHAGIYLGKWSNLPKPLQDKFKGRFASDLKLSTGNPALKESYLVVDSYTPRVMIRSFAEQFTHYYHKGALEVQGALKWESDEGGAAEYIPANDMRRWRIVEEALSMVEAQVQFPEVPPGGVDATVIENYRQPAKEPENLDKLYGSFPMDCITCVYVAYWRGAGERLEGATEIGLVEAYRKFAGDNKLKGVQSLDTRFPAVKGFLAKYSAKYRRVDLKPVYVEGAVLGPWNGKVRVERDGKRTDEPLTIYVTALPPESPADRAKEFQVQLADSETLDLRPGTEIRTLVRHNSVSGDITFGYTSGENSAHYEYDPVRDLLDVSIARAEGDNVVSFRGRLERGAKVWKLESDYELKVRFTNVAHKKGPVQAQLHVTKRNDRTFAPIAFEEPYVIMVELGGLKQFVYPINTKFPDAPMKYGRPVGFSRFTNIHVQILQQNSLPDEMVVTAVLPHGERLVERIKIPYETAPEMTLADRLRQQVADATRRLEEAIAMPAEKSNRQSLIVRAAGGVLKGTPDRNEASRVWRVAREEIRGTQSEESQLSSLEVNQLEGAWLRGDPGLYRTLLTQREEANQVTANQYLTLMQMLVLYHNDVESARGYWPKFIAAVKKMPLAQQKRLHYDEAIQQVLLLPEQPVR